MKTRFRILAALVATVAFATVDPSIAQTVVDAAEVARSTIKADRKVVIAENLQLTEAEGNAFWPLYRDYRFEIEKANDEVVKLVLEYADLYPDVPDDRAKEMLKKYTSLEKRLVEVRAKHLRKIGKVVPATKVLRFAQLENRLDLAVRMSLAASIPLVPTIAKPQ